MSSDHVMQATSRTGLGPTIPAWRLRVVVAAAVVITVVTATVALTPATWLIVVMAAAGVATVARPRSHAATALVAVVLATSLGADGPGWWLAPLVLGLHATHVGASIAALVPVAADVEVAALRPTLRRFAAVQIGAQVLVLAFVLAR